jgi:citrate lyase beta subunit
MRRRWKHLRITTKMKFSMDGKMLDRQHMRLAGRILAMAG